MAQNGMALRDWVTQVSRGELCRGMERRDMAQRVSLGKASSGLVWPGVVRSVATWQVSPVDVRWGGPGHGKSGQPKANR